MIKYSNTRNIIIITFFFNIYIKFRKKNQNNHKIQNTIKYNILYKLCL